MKNIKISIITITYNSEETVRETLDSIRKQHYDNLEYIVIDGGSSDHTLDIVRDYSDIVSVLISEKDNGISDAMNKGIQNATGDLIGIIHSDDMLEDESLKKLNKIWDGITDVYYGNVVVCDEFGIKKHILKSESNLCNMQYRFGIVHPATFIAKTCYDKYGIFNLKYKCAMDYDLLLRFYKAGAKFKYIDDNLAVYREGGMNQKNRKKTIDEVCQISIDNGGSRIIAKYERAKKLLKDSIKPIIKKFHIKNKRVTNL